jgi:MFS family permease
MRRWAFAALAVALIAGSSSTARAEVNVERRGSENGMVEIARSTMYGALAGFIVGGAIALAAKDDSGEPLRWGIVVGTFAGLGYGVYQVATRPAPTALIELKDGELRAHALPTVQAQPGGARVYLLSKSF